MVHDQPATSGKVNRELHLIPIGKGQRQSTLCCIVISDGQVPCVITEELVDKEKVDRGLGSGGTATATSAAPPGPATPLSAHSNSEHMTSSSPPGTRAARSFSRTTYP